MSRSSDAKDRYIKEGRIIPECVNINCLRDATIRHVNEGGNISWHNMCSRCKRQHESGESLDDGITNIRKNVCDNSDGDVRAGPDRDVIQPGWDCPIAHKEDKSHHFILDHIDGDHTNNDPENLQTLCRYCDAEKSKRSGDWGR
jgi:hypothetical protein